jgi:hypothetical protein
LSNYNLRKIALYLGVSVAVFLFSCGLVGYEAYVTSWIAEYSRYIGLPPPLQRFFLVDWIWRSFFGPTFHDFLSAVFIVEFIGILGMIAGITGIAYVIRGIVVPVIYRRKHNL